MSVGKASIKRALGAKEPKAVAEEAKAPVAAESAKPAKKPAAKKPAAKKPAAKKPVAKKPAAKAPVTPANEAPAKISLGDALPYFLL